jgi:hypothetical protein
MTFFVLASKMYFRRVSTQRAEWLVRGDDCGSCFNIYGLFPRQTERQAMAQSRPMWLLYNECAINAEFV